MRTGYRYGCSLRPSRQEGGLRRRRTAAPGGRGRCVRNGHVQVQLFELCVRCGFKAKGRDVTGERAVQLLVTIELPHRTVQATRAFSFITLGPRDQNNSAIRLLLPRLDFNSVPGPEGPRWRPSAPYSRPAWTWTLSGLRASRPYPLRGQLHSAACDTAPTVDACLICIKCLAFAEESR